MIDVDIVKLEDGKEYTVFDTLEFDNRKYLFLFLNDNKDSITIRKVIKEEDNQEYLVKLDNNEEFDEVLAMFLEKYKGEDNEK